MFGRGVKKRKSYVTVLDIGTAKVCGFMAHIGADNKPEIIGVGYAPAKGIKAGAIVDLEKASECIGSVLNQIEKQAERPVKSVTINVSSGQLKSRCVAREVKIPDSHPITAMDVKHLVDGIIGTTVPPEEEVLHAFPLSYAVDKEQNVSDPRGLYAETLKACVHLITIPETQLRNLVQVLDRFSVEIDKKVATPYAAALAVLDEEEKDAATVIDFGAGMTSYSLFINGGLIYLGIIPVGGQAITKDIAHMLSCSMTTAERLKTVNGSAFLSPKDELDHVIVPVVGEENENNRQIPRSELIKVIIPRLNEIVDGLADVLSGKDIFAVPARRLVLCGGGSKLQGIKEKIEGSLSAPTRLYRPSQIKNLPNQFDSFTFITCIGLLEYVLATFERTPMERFDEQAQHKSRIGKVLQWLVK